MEEAIKVMNDYDLGGKSLKVGACITPPSLQNVTTTAYSQIKDEDKLKPAKMLSDMIKRIEAAAAAGVDIDDFQFDQPKAITSKKGSAAADKVIFLLLIVGNDIKGVVVAKLSFQKSLEDKIKLEYS
jgi:hypothetical protein